MSGKYVFSKGLKELRFLFCQSSEQSAATRSVHQPSTSDRALLPLHGALSLQNGSDQLADSMRSIHRSFINRAYPTMKKHNPHTPIMIREAAGTEPRVFARYAFGKETQEALSGLSDSQIEERITNLVKQAS
ncbi:NADH-ubiquinone oxidoreductase 10.5 kDa subunit [Penicillium diatomitis]|uniref:NADH-ubiquinone oxidoreductase 10.5 kDa subunit n=1 Tax=Penicillium diatomitis TaxID=2819901 RepID=A0A9W9X658_9EURO|nr:NADH-ubiquinone oxidoreductase 10.5 kDa subunit [Penicillium diatomitis]KAJ5484841.1 NADH-ubiquinone oxidoreductase 10.5 kDa subunit [Penicillium diatomitis]